MLLYGVDVTLLEDFGINPSSIRSKDELCLKLYKLSQDENLGDKDRILNLLRDMSNHDMKPKISVINDTDAQENTPLLKRIVIDDCDEISVSFPTDNIYPDLTSNVDLVKTSPVIQEVQTPTWRKLLNVIKNFPRSWYQHGLAIIVTILFLCLLPYLLEIIGFGANGIKQGSLVAYLESISQKGVPKYMKGILGIFVYFYMMFKLKRRNTIKSIVTTHESVQTDSYV